MVWAHKYDDGEKFYQITCDCGCEYSTKFWLGKDEDAQDFVLRISTTTRYTVWKEYNKFLPFEILLNIKKRLSAALRILFTGEIVHSSEVIIGEANIDDLFAIIKDARKDIKVNSAPLA